MGISSSPPSGGNDFAAELRRRRWPLLLCLMVLLGGFSLGGIFGGLEEPVKAAMQERADVVKTTVYEGSEVRARGAVARGWNALKIAHVHANGLATTGLVLLMLLAAGAGSSRLGMIAGWLFTVGAVGYPLYWLIAAWRSVSLGGMDVAHQAYEWLAIPSAAALLLGLASGVVCVILAWWRGGRGGSNDTSAPAPSGVSP